MSSSTTRERPGFITCLVIGLLAIVFAIWIIATGSLWWGLGWVVFGLAWIGYGFYLRRKR